MLGAMGVFYRLRRPQSAARRRRSWPSSCCCRCCSALAVERGVLPLAARPVAAARGGARRHLARHPVARAGSSFGIQEKNVPSFLTGDRAVPRRAPAPRAPPRRRRRRGAGGAPLPARVPHEGRASPCGRSRRTRRPRACSASTPTASPRSRARSGFVARRASRAPSWRPIYSLNPGMGLEAILMSFLIIIVGGLGSITGTVLAGLLVGVLQSVGRRALRRGGGLRPRLRRDDRRARLPPRRAAREGMKRGLLGLAHRGARRCCRRSASPTCCTWPSSSSSTWSTRRRSTSSCGWATCRSATPATSRSAATPPRSWRRSSAYQPWLGFLAGGVVAAVFAWALGTVTLKLRGIYFSLSRVRVRRGRQRRLPRLRGLRRPRRHRRVPRPVFFGTRLNTHLQFYYVVLARRARLAVLPLPAGSGRASASRCSPCAPATRRRSRRASASTPPATRRSPSSPRASSAGSWAPSTSTTSASSAPSSSRSSSPPT